MLDGRVISAIIQSRDAYDRVRDHLSKDDLSPEGQMWYPLIKQWYMTDRNARSIDQALLIERAELTLPEAHKQSLISWLTGIAPEESPANVVLNLIEVKKFINGNKLCEAIQGRKHKEIETLLEEYSGLLQATSLGTSEITWTMDDEEMDAALDQANKIKIAPKRLNDRLGGGMIPGDHLLIFGRPESWKTGFTVNVVSGILRQGKRVLYVGNEESTYKPRKRIVNNLSGMAGEEYEANKDLAMQKARENGFDNLHICRMYPGTLAEVEEAVKDIRPDVVVVDQIRGLDHPVQNGNRTEKLTVLGERFRNLGAKHNFLAISITQAGDKTERHGQEVPEWMGMGDIDSNRTGLAGAVDVLLAVGTTAELEGRNQRAISICKNKNNDADDAKEGFYIEIDKRLSRAR